MSSLLDQKINEKRDKGSTSIGPNDIVQLQDDISKMTEGQIIKKWSNMSPGERSTFIWIVFKVLDFDTAIFILKSTAVAGLVERSVKEETAALTEMYESEHTKFRTARKEAWVAQENVKKANRTLEFRDKEIKELRSKIAGLEAINEAAMKELRKAQALNESYRAVVRDLR